MRVAMVAYAFFEGNARIQQYASALVQRGDSVDIFALRQSGQPEYMNIKGVNFYGIQERVVNEVRQTTYLFRILRFLLHSAVVLTKQHHAEPYDIIHVHSVPDFLVFSALVPKLSGAAVVLDIHDIPPEFYASKFGASRKSILHRLLLLVERSSAALADHVVVANHLWRERLANRSVRSDKCTAVCNYPDPNVFRPLPRTRANGNFRIIYPGSLNSHQGLDIAIRAFGRIAGEIRLATELGLNGRVVFHKALPLERIAEEMANSDLAVVPKRASSLFGNEAASTKILECMAVGVPVIVSQTKVDTYYHSEQTVKFFESGSDAALADAILQLHRQPELRTSLVRNAARHAQANNWAAKQHIYLDLLDSLVCGKAGTLATAH